MKQFSPGERLFAADLNDNFDETQKASNVTSGAFAAARIGNLPASKITSGAFNADRIPNLNASKITAGVLNDARVRIKGIGPKVVSVGTNSVTTTTSESFINVTGLAATITPTSATSKILVLAQVVVSVNNAESAASRLRVVRGSTSLGEFAAFNTDAPSNSFQGFGFGTAFLDSPATTAATTYTVQVRSGRNIRTVRVNRTGNGSGAATSVITLIEVAG